MMTHRAVSRWHRPQSWGDTLGRPSMRKAAHCGEDSSCILCLLSCMPPSSSRPCLVLPLHHSQVALAQPAVLGGCRPAWGDAVHGRPPASHLNSAVWHAAGFSSYVCRARRTPHERARCMRWSGESTSMEQTNTLTNTLTLCLLVYKHGRKYVSQFHPVRTPTSLQFWPIISQTKRFFHRLASLAINNGRISWILPRNCPMSFLSAVHSRGDCGAVALYIDQSALVDM